MNPAHTLSAVNSHPFAPSLPPELWDLIIDALGDDRDVGTGGMPESTDSALRSCTLVCRNWHYRAKKQLLHQGIILDDVDPLKELERKFRGTSRLTPHVQNLELRLQSTGQYAPRNVLTILPVLFSLGVSTMDNLRVIGLHSVGSRSQSPIATETPSLPYLSLHPHFPSMFTPAFASVRDLSLANLAFRNFSDFGKFLSCFTRLEELQCSRILWQTLGLVPGCMTRNTGRAFLPRLRKLSVGQLHLPLDTRTHTALLSDLGHQHTRDQ